MMAKLLLWCIHIAAGFTALVAFWITLRSREPGAPTGGLDYVLGVALVTVIVLALVLSSGGIATALYRVYFKPAVSSVDGILAEARATMKASGNCFLITLDESGQPQARVMQPFEPEADMTVWMGTNRSTRKVQQMRRDPRATLAYYDAEGAGYVVLIGKTSLVEDLSERRKRYMKSWDSFFPDGPTGSSFVLIQFVPEHIEMMSFTRAVATKPYTWRPAILSREDIGWSVEGH